MRFHDVANVLGQLAVFLFPALSGSGGEVLQAAHASAQFVQPFGDGVASPTEASFGLTGVAVAEFQGHLGQEQAALVALEPLSSRKEQGIVTSKEVVHVNDQKRGGTVDCQLLPSRHCMEGGPR